MAIWKKAKYLGLGAGTILMLYWIVPRLVPQVEDPRTEDQIKAEHRVLAAYLQGRLPEWFVSENAHSDDT